MRRSLRHYAVVLALLLAAAHGAAAQEGPERWEDDIRAFEAADAAHPVARGGILFTGSSSIRLWTSLARDFPGLPVINRGFGGSQIHEVTHFAPRVVRPYAPRLIVLYAGTNDIANGKPVDRAVADVEAFVAAVHATLPNTRIAFISAAPNPARWHLRQEMQEFNRRVRAYAASDPRLAFIDVWPHMLGADGLPKPGIFVEDRLHMNERGYAIWREVVGRFLAEADR
ncbi:MAG TPA: SGNH/GDSL hydrolase family protein [Gemmatimonadales bacterium]|nr:SGNH/GDSL hydrolase family protein [Gemmatimonadales bacterium]